jgi:hypothetical protein
MLTIRAGARVLVTRVGDRAQVRHLHFAFAVPVAGFDPKDVLYQRSRVPPDVR